MALLGGHQPIDFTEGLQQGKRHRLGNLAGFIVVVCTTVLLISHHAICRETIISYVNHTKGGNKSANMCHSEPPLTTYVPCDGGRNPFLESPALHFLVPSFLCLRRLALLWLKLLTCLYISVVLLVTHL